MKYKVGDRVVCNGYKAFGVMDGYKGTVRKVSTTDCVVHFDEVIDGWGDKRLRIPKPQGLYVSFEYLTLIEKEENL